MQDIDSYKTIDQSSEGEFKDRGSKFIAYLQHIKTEEDFVEMLADVKSKHLKARHHCFAYQLLDKNLFRSNDDGEPSGTAGKPIFNQLLSHQLVNVCCIVVRYFGGTKLGTSGLINAYKEATKQAITNNEIVTKYKLVQYKIAFDYSQMGQLLETLKKLNIQISDKILNESPSIIISEKESELVNSVIRIKAHLLRRNITDINDKTIVPGIHFDPSI